MELGPFWLTSLGRTIRGPRRRRISFDADPDIRFV
jgi:hypothetical protein